MTIRAIAFVTLLSSLLGLTACGFRLAGDAGGRFPAGTTFYVDGDDVFRRRESLRQALTRAGGTLADEKDAMIILNTDTDLSNRALQIDNNADATELEQARVTTVTYSVASTQSTGYRRFSTTRQRVVVNNDITGGARLAERLNDEMAIEQNQQITAWLVRELSANKPAPKPLSTPSSMPSSTPSPEPSSK